MSAPSLRRRDERATERMDDPGCDLTALHRTYAQFRLVNAVVAGWRVTYRRHLRPLLRREGPTSLLDVGCGGGDLARALARWARRDGHRLEVTGVDPDERAHAWAARQPPVPGVRFRRARSGDLVAAGERFDLVVSNHLLHHLDPEQLAALLEDSRVLARRRAVHSDIARSRWAYALFSAGTRPFFPGSFIREDGLTSIRRSFTAAELAAAVPAGWRVERPWPARTLLVHDAAGG
ncbi:class I SAM-dependent methyltransferase [Kineococcus indalonis]|uniref:class I SAM-dependent methyltransferase n=1 Tax=Kineococcus indalonis TaxID=2696566 RepID=UPI001411C8B2|nr:class I SAM-dependent methyltransferase [Kineococcus indalonis]NAZ86008.1 methyltransferase domain-containing protein [Kineococcus indalonis]